MSSVIWSKMEYKKWAVFLANLDPVIGSEQGKTRPVLLISENFFNELLNVVNAIPITSYKSGRIIYPNEVFLEKEITNLPNNSIALIHQIRTIDKKRLVKKLGNLDTPAIQ